MSWKRCSLPLLVMAFLGLWFFCHDRNVSFSDLQEARTVIQAAGYPCSSASAHGKVGFGFLVSRQPHGWEEVNQLRKVGRMGPEWEGKVWLATVNDGLTRLETIPDNADPRVWGNVVAFGDRTLLDEIESAVRQTSAL